MRVLVVPCDGEQPARVEEVARISLDVLQRLVGVDDGLLDAATIGAGVRVWVHDTGMLDGLPANLRVTRFRHEEAVRAGYAGGFPSPYSLHGDVVVVGPIDEAGDETSVPQRVVEHFCGEPR